MLQTFNNRYRLGPVVEGLSQEEILNTPEYYAMSFEQIITHPSCPKHLERVLLDMPWDGRPNYVQVRPQDFRTRDPEVLGRGWHVDINTALANGRMHWARDLDEFRSMVVSFGDVAETEFLEGPLMINTSEWDPRDHCKFADYINGRVAREGLTTVALAPNQIATYTTRDVHRIRPKYRRGRARLIIVTVEQDSHLEDAAGVVRPTISQRGAK